MKIIDFWKKGNVVRFYLGRDDCNDYHGDDWNDTPYEHNAGTVYDEYVVDYMDVVFPFDWLVMEPAQDYHNSGNSAFCKDDMRDRKVPCIVAVSPDLYDDSWRTDDEFNYWLGNANAVKIYFNDPQHKLMDYDCIIIRPPKGYVDGYIAKRIESMYEPEEEEDEN